jgi:hypothetical protein
MASQVAEGVSLFYMTPPTTLSPVSPISAPSHICTPCTFSQRRARYSSVQVHNKFVRRPKSVNRDHVCTHGEASWFYTTASTRTHGGEAWERDLLSHARVNSDGEASRRRLYASLVQDQGPKVCAYSSPTPHSGTKYPIKATNPTPTHQELDARTRFFSRRLRQKSWHPDCEPHGIFCTPLTRPSPCPQLLTSFGP